MRYVFGLRRPPGSQVDGELTIGINSAHSYWQINLGDLTLNGAAALCVIVVSGPTIWLDLPRLACDRHLAQPRRHRRLQCQVQCCAHRWRDSP